MSDDKLPSTDTAVGGTKNSHGCALVPEVIQRLIESIDLGLLTELRCSRVLRVFLLKEAPRPRARFLTVVRGAGVARVGRNLSARTLYHVCRVPVLAECWSLLLTVVQVNGLNTKNGDEVKLTGVQLRAEGAPHSNFPTESARPLRILQGRL